MPTGFGSSTDLATYGFPGGPFCSVVAKASQEKEGRLLIGHRWWRGDSRHDL
jgi:hypothetical protein